MTTWNYRIVRHGGADPWLGVHEVYYDDAGNPIMMTDPISFTCGEDEGPEGLVKSLEQALADAKDRPVLDASEIGARERTGSQATPSPELEIIDGANDFASDDPRSPTSIARASDVLVLIATLENEYSLPSRAAGPLSTSLEWEEIKRRLTGVDPLADEDESSGGVSFEEVEAMIEAAIEQAARDAEHNSDE